MLLVCLMSVPLEPKEAEVTPLYSEDLTDLPNKEGVMITVVYPPGSSGTQSIATTHMRLSMSLRAPSLCQ